MTCSGGPSISWRPATQAGDRHERDVLRSQGEQFPDNLRAAGVPTTLSLYQGVMHAFFGAATVLDKAAQAQQEAADHFRAAFSAAQR